MRTYSMAVTYAAGNTQQHEGLTADQVDHAVRAFTRDLLRLEGRGITRMTVEIDPTPEEVLAKHLAGWALGNLQTHILHEHRDGPLGLLYTDPLDLVHDALHVGRT